MDVSISNFVFTGIVYLPVSFVVAYLSYKYYIIRKNDLLWKLLFFEFSLLTVVTLCGALAGTVFTDNSEMIAVTLVISSFILSFSNAILGYLFIYYSKLKISPWIGFYTILILGLIVSVITMLAPISPVVESNGGVNWGMPFYLELLRAFVYFIGLIPATFVIIRKYNKAPNLDVKRQFLFLLLFFIFTFLVVLTDFIIEPLLDSPALLSELIILILAVVSMVLFLIINENSFRKIEKRYKHVIFNLKEMIFVLDKDLNIVFVNPAVKKVLNVNEEILNKSILNIVHPNDRVLVENIYFPKETQSNTKIEFRFITGNNNVKWATTANQPVEIKEWESKSNVYLLACPDITEIKELQHSLLKAKGRVEESNKLKSAFISNINHEVRTPLNAIIGFSSLLINENNDTVKADYQNIIETRSDHLLRLISDIIDISHIDSDQLILNESETSVSEIVNSAYYSAESLLKEHRKTDNIELITNCKFENKRSIICDGDRLKQVFVNLIDNAVKFTKKGKIEIGCYLKNETTIEFYVTDTGIGISEEKHEIVFSYFRQVEENFLKTMNGTGIGLSLTRSLVTLMGGDIILESTPEVGSTFKFNIPYKAVEQKSVKQNGKTSDNHYNWNGKTILVVDDDPAIRLLITRFIERTGANLVTAVDGKQAIDFVESNNEISLVLMDLKMPKVDGFTAIEKIKKLDPNIPIIVQSAFYQPEYKEKAYEYGCSEYFKKPIKQQPLLALLNNYI